VSEPARDYSQLSVRMAVGSSPSVFGSAESSLCHSLIARRMAGGGDSGTTYSNFSGFVFTFNLIVGAGALALPLAFLRAGLVRLNGLLIPRRISVAVWFSGDFSSIYQFSLDIWNFILGVPGLSWLHHDHLCRRSLVDRQCRNQRRRGSEWRGTLTLLSMATIIIASITFCI